MTDKRNPTDATPFTRNRLTQATSPYLLQHKDNPVHWQPWEAAVFDEARRRGVPVLLSIGYAACHWCHVMAHESFEDDEVAALMNAHFVCIKLDREERPDLDEIYMSALAIMGEQGGWPLTICLDADGAPFWGGTYFPKTPQYGRPGFMQILNEISRVWHETPDKIAANTKALTQSLTAKAKADARSAMPQDLPARAAKTLADHIDLEKGGLAGAPKFPQPFLYKFIWQQAQLSGDPEIQEAMQEAVLMSARKMCQGGIYDHIGGGFARYSVDADWLVPHFEKMLYDNALLIDLLSLLYRHSREPLFKSRIEETIDWLAREMRVEGGCFAASLDADTEGEEGKFYVWDKAEIEAALGDAAAAFCAAYDITDKGNFEGRNIPNLLAQGDAPQDTHKTARNKLRALRNSRIAPGRDDKILADWNAMMIAALADAARQFRCDDWQAMAETAYAAARKALTDDNGNLRHAARGGAQLPVSLSSDYGFFGLASLALYEASGHMNYLDDAVHYATTLHERFHDAQRGGYLSNEQEQSNLLVNNRPVQDNAQPSANATALRLFQALFVLTGDAVWQARSRDGFTALAGHLAQNYPSMTAMLSAHLAQSHPLSIIIIGDDAQALELEQAALAHSIALRHILRLPPQKTLPQAHPASGKKMIDGQATAYICLGQSCLAPLTSVADVNTALDELITQRQTETIKPIGD